MKKLSQRSVLLVGVVLVVCAFVPSMASAASWSPLGSTHQLTATNLSVTSHTSPLGAAAGWICNGSEFDVDVASAVTLTITNVRFSNCMGSDAASPCTVTVMPTGLPWAATATSTTDIQIHNVQVDILFEQTPGQAACPAAGAKVSLTGTMRGGSWNPANNSANLTPAIGLTAHWTGFGLSSSTTMFGTISDVAGSLKMLM